MGGNGMGFPSAKILSWALPLPLAMPTYIVAFAWLDLLHPIGPLQTFIRFILGFDSPRQFRLPDLRSLSGAIILLGLVLYPYVYLTTRAMFISQPAHLLEAARTLGCSATGTFSCCSPHGTPGTGRRDQSGAAGDA